MTIPTNADVVVVGAGFAGLAAARELVRRGHDVVVLEGRDRVGGRSSTTTIAGVPVDLGGTFVGPTQDAVVALAAELGCETVPTHSRGKNLIRWRGKVRSYRSTIPKLSIIELLDVSRIQWRFDRVSRRVPVDEPWTSPIAEILDSKTLDQWLRYVHASAGTRDLMAIMARVTWGCEPDAVSMLHAVRYVKAAGGLGRMLDVEGRRPAGPLPRRHPADRGADGRGTGATRGAGCSGAQHRTAHQRRHADRHIGRGHGRSEGRHRRDPAGTSRGHRVPAGPAARVRQARPALAAGQPEQGLRRLRDTVLARRRLSGEALSDEGPVFITFDVSPGDDGPGILLGFTDARTFDPLPPADRRERALAGFAALFGDAALNPIDYVDHCWGAEEFAPGGPTAAVPPGSWTTYGPWLRKPVDGIHWAGTETADKWTGFLDGAIRSGQRAADEVDRELSARS